ncbi:MAG TPA: septum formation initiator family protein [Ignavibacteria bacterium]|nr:septum formation initiator family protein [Ignavibacteria bacterium]
MVQKSKIKYFVFSLIILIGLVYVLFNKYGIFKYWKLERQVNKLENRISTIKNENKILEAEIDSLKKKVPAKIEKIAREKYNMKRKNEQVIRVKEK